MTTLRIARRSLAALAVLLGCTVWAADGATGPPAVWLGVFVEEVDGGVELVGVVPGGPADRQGLRQGDVLVRMAGRPLARLSDLEEVLRPLRAGDPIAVELLRAGGLEEVGLRVGRRESHAAALPRAPEIAGRAGAVGWRLVDVTPDLRRHFGAPEEAGVLVTGILEGPSADAGGLRVGDVLVALGEQRVRCVSDVAQVLGDRPAGEQELHASVVRERRAQALTLILPASRRVAAEDAPAAPPPFDRAALERAIRAEIERLARRIEDLREELGALPD